MTVGIGERFKDQSAEVRAAIEAHIWQLRVAEPGIIKEFDPDEQVVKVQLAIMEHLLRYVGMTSIEGGTEKTKKPKVPTYLRKPEAITPLIKVPILMPRANVAGTDYSITLPIKPGDECLVIFGDSCFDKWWKEGGVQPQIERRRHDLSDGFAILAPWSQPNRYGLNIQPYNPDYLEIRTGDRKVLIQLTPDTINILAPHEINITSLDDGTVNVHAKEVNVTADDTVTVTAKEVNVEDSDTVTVNAKDVDVTASDTVNIQGVNINILASDRLTLEGTP